MKKLDACFYRFETRTDALEAVIDGMVQIAKFPLGASGQHINLFGDGLKMLFEAAEALLKVSSSETQREFRPRPRGVEHAPPFGYPDSVSASGGRHRGRSRRSYRSGQGDGERPFGSADPHVWWR